MRIDNKQIWFTADFHFGHKKIIEYCNRPFESVIEMNSALIKNYNKVVGKNDIVYILGDLSWLNRKSTTQIIKNLNGFKFLVKGNHDFKGNQYYRNMGFVEVYDHPIIIHNNIILSHKPILINQLKSSPFMNIHGHMHNNELINEINDEKHYCVSVECTNYKPVSLLDLNIIPCTSSIEDLNIISESAGW